MLRTYCAKKAMKLPQCKLPPSRLPMDASKLSQDISEFLKQLIAISQTLSEGEGQLARAEFKLAMLYREKGMITESDQCKVEALRLRKKLRPQEDNEPFEEDSFMKLCLWMLW